MEERESVAEDLGGHSASSSLNDSSHKEAHK